MDVDDDDDDDDEKTMMMIILMIIVLTAIVEIHVHRQAILVMHALASVQCPIRC